MPISLWNSALTQAKQFLLKILILYLTYCVRVRSLYQELEEDRYRQYGWLLSSQTCSLAFSCKSRLQTQCIFYKCHNRVHRAASLASEAHTGSNTCDRKLGSRLSVDPCRCHTCGKSLVVLGSLLYGLALSRGARQTKFVLFISFFFLFFWIAIISVVVIITFFFLIV